MYDQGLGVQPDVVEAHMVVDRGLAIAQASGSVCAIVNPMMGVLITYLRGDRALVTGIVVWKLDRLGRSLTHLVNTVQDLSTRGVGLRVLTGQGAQIDTTTAAGRGAGRVRAELIRERTLAGLTAARARGRHGGGKFALSKTQVRLAQVAIAHRDTSVSALCRELGINPVTLYRYVGPQGDLEARTSSPLHVSVG